MPALRVLCSRLRALWTVRQREQDLTEEIETHLSLIADERMRQGLSPDDARASARVTFGGAEQIKETYRDQRSLPFLEVLAQDVRYGARTIQKRPGFAVITILTIAIGISASTTIFTIGNALLFRAAPGVAQQDRLIEVVRTEGQDFGVRFTSYPDYVDMRERVTRLESVYAYHLDLTPLSLRASASAERVFGSIVSINYFDALGVTPAAGRLFGHTDSERPGASPLVVLSHRFWTRDSTRIQRSSVGRCCSTAIRSPSSASRTSGSEV